MAVFKFIYKLVFERLPFRREQFQRVGLGNVLAYKFFLACQEFLHFLFYQLEIRLADYSAFRGHHIIIEAVLNSRAYAELCSGEKFLNSLGH